MRLPASSPLGVVPGFLDGEEREQDRQTEDLLGRELAVLGFGKPYLHNAEMVDRFIAMSAKHANLRLNNTDFKELLFYGVRAVA